jgi:hypothetical protein
LLSRCNLLILPLSYMVLSIFRAPGEAMWIIELNVAGYHFSREIPDLRRRTFRFSPRNAHWPVARHSNAA